MPLDLKRKKADIYVENTGTPEDMFANVLRKLNKVLGKKK
jgi:dephospho-CoA kinase